MIDDVEPQAGARAEQTKFHELALVTSAEDVVRTARMTDLGQAQRDALQRVTQARDRLTRAQQDGDVDATASAAQQLRERQDEAEQIVAQGIAEMQRLMAGGIDNIAAMLHQMTRAWDEASTGLLDGPAARPDEG